MSVQIGLVLRFWLTTTQIYEPDPVKLAFAYSRSRQLKRSYG